MNEELGNVETKIADCARPQSDETVPPTEPAQQEQPSTKKRRSAREVLRHYAHRYFIEAFSGMALGLFCTLIIGTIIAQLGAFGDNGFCKILQNIGYIAKLLMGAGIGVGIAHSLKAKRLTGFSAAVAGMVGANITNIFALSGIHVYGASANPAISIGDPVGAFVGAVAAIEIANLVEEIGRAHV